MEVYLKKTKITNSVFKQILTVNAYEFQDLEIIGFCVYKNVQWILFVKKSTKEIRKYLQFKDVKIEDNHSNDVYLVKVSFNGGYSPISYITNSEEERDVLIKEIRAFKEKSIIFGQIFL